MEGKSVETPVRGNDSSVGVAIQPQHNKTRGFDQRQGTAFPPLFDEIRVLQERLLDLEAQAAHQWKTTVEDVSPENDRSVGGSKIADSDEDRALRNRIRKAPYGTRWVEKTEQQAEEEADARHEYGQGPNKAQPIPYAADSTMYQIGSGGNLMEPYLFGTIHPPNKDRVETLLEDIRLRHRHKPFPHKGVRPPTAIHPFYNKPYSEQSPRQQRSLSRKLGPPTAWDQSDSEEWSSDTSTRSQDFNYFRARLRGDFEWELDRLNAQVKRYKKHQSKKKSRQLATKAREENEMRSGDFEAHEQRDTLIAQLELDAEASRRDRHGIRQLNPVGWSVFRLTGSFSMQYSWVIDVLVEEPKISSDARPWVRTKNFKKDKTSHKDVSSFQAPAAETADDKDDTEQHLQQPAPWTAYEPLPERIRINSKQILDILSTIHGSPLCSEVDTPSSVVLLRPFRVLDIYDKEIRDTCSRLRAGTDTESIKSASEGEHTSKEQNKTNFAPEGKLMKKPTNANDETKALQDEEEIVSGEESSLKGGHLGCLCEFMNDYIGRRTEYLNSVSCSKIFFSDVWHLFQPGTTVISADGKQAYRIINLKSKRHKGADRWAAFLARQHDKKSRKPDSSDSQVDDTHTETSP
ncbi:hypothetical protein Daus18300_010263 [Diaporthe australafricana]|uniref:Uncharacterized protein n=1 Tax=Diaporthe australafricana TaxID=127596 RepID=A0ABR3WB93_9PEZI